MDEFEQSDSETTDSQHLIKIQYVIKKKKIFHKCALFSLVFLAGLKTDKGLKA